VVHHLLNLAGDQDIMRQVSAAAWLKLEQLEQRLIRLSGAIANAELNAHYTYLSWQIELFKRNPADYKVPEAPAMPDGSPIGCGY